MSRSRGSRNGGRPNTGDRRGDATAGLAKISASDKPYLFTVDGKTHRLPPPGPIVEKCLTGGRLIDIMADENKGSMQLAIAAITHADIAADTVAALRQLPAEEFVRHLNRWLESGGVDVGKYLRSVS